jgi:hypothetical protein
LPFDVALRAGHLDGPSANLVVQRLDIADSPISKALARHAAQFVLGDVQPTPVLRCVDELESTNIQQTERPFSISFGRVAKAHSDDLGFLFAVERFGFSVLLLLVLERPLEPLRHAFLSHILHGLSSTPERIGNLLFGPARSIRIRLEKDVCSFYRLVRGKLLALEVPKLGLIPTPLLLVLSAAVLVIVIEKEV